ncbi:Sec63 Brl domain-containing protein, partial [Gorgonomyces haynaldii]
DDQIQSRLLDLLGFDDLDFIGTLIHQRHVITREKPVGKQAEKKKNRQQRKQQASETLKMLDGQDLRQQRVEQLQANQVRQPLRKAQEVEKYPNVYQAQTGSVLSMFGTQFVLPEGTIRTDIGNDFEEISIPINKSAPVRSNEKPVMIESFPPWVQSCFPGYASLNRMQSIVYPIAYETNENMLVCAPTGAGKTDVAMLTVIRTLSQYRTGNLLDLDQFKIVYVAPMKALAAEVVGKFSKRLKGLGVQVRELTGDMQMTKAELNATQMIVTTPEKWDVVTRKGAGDTELVPKVKLLIVDEVHLLHEDRGAVIESIIARTLRLVESSQSMIRIVGLSATLPNYVDVAQFLGVNLYKGLFYFDAGFRPVPLEQHFVGVKGKAGTLVYRHKLNAICYTKVQELVREGHQVMVFVHSRKDTVHTAQSLLEEAQKNDELGIFNTQEDPLYSQYVNQVQKSRNKELKELFVNGMGIHHAGMLRQDRTLTEQLFEKGLLRVLCCTATLAWGVNLPAYAVVIKGTTIYNADKGSFVDLSILDVLQIFGRAGRPQYEDRGCGYILTSHDKLNHYISSMTQQFPIESKFAEHLVDNLNAEISLGTVTNVQEAAKWLSYTYLFVRMRKNPFEYGMDWNTARQDPTLAQKRIQLISSAAQQLHKAQMIVYDERTGYLIPKDLGRIASNFYILHESIETFNKIMRPNMTEADVLWMVSMSSEFSHLVSRPEEGHELQRLYERDTVCAVKGTMDTNYGKANILLQAYITRSNLENFALVSDSYYVSQNASRILRALFEISMSRNWGPTAQVILSLCKSVDKRMWSFQHPLIQFEFPQDLVPKIEKLGESMSIDLMRDMTAKELGQLVRHERMGKTVLQAVNQFPVLHLEATIAPITRTVLRIVLEVSADFDWSDRVHGQQEPFWIWVEDSEGVEILYSEYFMLQKKKVRETQVLGFTIPIPRTDSTQDGLVPQVFIRAVSDRWMGSETVLPVSFKHLILPGHDRAQHTDLLDLRPLPISALKDPILEEICGKRFQFFNPVQTQIFHTLYHTNHNVLIGAPTGSGKTVAAELAMWHAFREQPKSKVVYIAPLKALVRERVADWKKRLYLMGRNLVELTGDVTPDLKTIQNADIIITTPEKFDGVSRDWQRRSYIQEISLVIIDEIHLLGNDRGPILEIIVSRMNYISNQRSKKIRILGLSTALANAGDLGDWLGIKHVGLFNFRHSVRPVPLEIYIEGHPGKHYCPRMIAMNKPTYQAILTHSPDQPVIVFVSSRRQTRLTAQDLISLCAGDDHPKRFLHMHEQEMQFVTQDVQDQSLKSSLGFGIGLHHAGLVEQDRKLVEELFLNGKIQILVATSTLAWGVNFPAHLVVVKGTEYYDAKSKTYVDFPITDVLQMMGRAGRVQFDNSGVAVILVHDVKKNFYKKFLHEPFPVESSLHLQLHEHMNAEVASGSIKTKQDAVDYLAWTYLYRRIQMNPTYYGLEDQSDTSIAQYLSKLVEKTFEDLIDSGCVVSEDGFNLLSTPYGEIASHYYLKHGTLKMFRKRLAKEYRPEDFQRLLRIICDANEYQELAVRHNEQFVNLDLEAELPYPINENEESPFLDKIDYDYGSPHVKAYLLLQAHLSRFNNFSTTDYHTDLITVMDQAIRIVQAAIETTVHLGYLRTTLGLMDLSQCLKQGLWNTDSDLMTLADPEQIPELEKKGIKSVQDLKKKQKLLNPANLKWFHQLPQISVDYTVNGAKEKDGRWFVEPNQQFEIQVTIKGMKQNIVSRFHKQQPEGWFIVVGYSFENQLLNMKRVSGDRTRLVIQSPESMGQYDLEIIIKSDGYRGLDLSLPLKLSV